MASPITSTTSIGTVQVAIGAVRIVDTSGLAREALEGERVFFNEAITTGGDAFVQVRLDNGQVIDLAHDSTVTLGEDVLQADGGAAGVFPAGSTADVAAMQAAIAAGADPGKVTEASAAGAPGVGGGDSGGGHTFVVLEQANTRGEVTAGYPTHPASITFPRVEPDPGLTLVEGETLPEPPPVIPNAPPVAASDTNWAQEDLVSATGNVLKDLAHTGAPQGSFADVADFDLEMLAVNGVNGAGANVGAPLTGIHGTLTVNADGTYTYAVNHASAAVQALDTGETLTEVFTYSVSDGFNEPASATLTITIFGTNDAPIAHADTNWVLEDGSAATGNVLQNLTHGGAPTDSFADVADTDIEGEALTVTTTGTFTGVYGTLVLNADGSYTYTLNNAHPGVQALGVGDRLTDSFSYTASDGSDTAPATLAITIFGSNDAPVIGSASMRVSEEGLDGAIPDTTGAKDTTDTADISGVIAVSDNDADTLTVTLSAPESPLYSNGAPIEWTGSGTKTLTGAVAGTPVAIITIDDSGAFTVVLRGPVDHADTSGEDEALFSVGVHAFDGTTTSQGALAITIEDDAPRVSVTEFQPALSVDESVLAADDSANFSASFAPAFGADGAGGVRYAMSLAGGSGVDSGLVDSVTGQNIVLVLSGNAAEGHVGSIGGVLAFILTLDPATGEVSLDQLRAVMHDSPDSPDISEPATLDTGLLKLVATATDADGDTHSALIDLGRAISFLDDGPSIIVPVTARLSNEAAATFTGALDFDSNVDDNAGADQRGSVTFDATQDGKDSGLTSGGSAIYLYVAEDGKTLTGSTAPSEGGVTAINTVFSVSIQQDQSLAASSDHYTVTMYGSVDNGSGIVFSDLSGIGPAGNPAWKVVESGEPGRALLFTPVSPATSVNSDSDDVGVDSQFIDHGKGLRIDFADLAVTGKAQSIDYSFGAGGHYTVNHFSFGINEIASGTVADILLRVYNADEDDPIDSTLGDDAQGAITGIRVYDAADNLIAAASTDATVGSIEFDFESDLAGGVTVRGLQEGYSVVTICDGGYDRIEIVNAGTDGEDGKFSLNDLEVLSIETGEPVDTSFALNLTDADGDSVPATISVTFEPASVDDMEGDAIEPMALAEESEGSAAGSEWYVASSMQEDDPDGDGPLVSSQGTLGSGGNGSLADALAEAQENASLPSSPTTSGEPVDVGAVLQGLLPNATSLVDYDGYVTLDTDTAPGHTIVMIDPTGGGNYTPLVTLADVTNMTLQELLEGENVLA